MMDPLNNLDHSITMASVFDEWEASQTGDDADLVESRRIYASRWVARNTRPSTDGTRFDRIVARLKARKGEGKA